MPKHTKGEWIDSQYQGDKPDGYYIQIETTKGKVIAQIENDIRSEDEALANAKLIAEAGAVANETGKTPRQLANELKGVNQSLILAIEFGYTQCEKGENIQAAIINYKKQN